MDKSAAAVHHVTMMQRINGCAKIGGEFGCEKCPVVSWEVVWDIFASINEAQLHRCMGWMEFVGWVGTKDIVVAYTTPLLWAS